MPYKSKSAFLAHGIEDVTLHIALDCSICREPLATTLVAGDAAQSYLPGKAVLSIGHTSVDAEATGERKTSHNDFATTMFPGDDLEPEHAVRIAPCNHTFGRICLEVWFNTSESNCCPECNQQLFPQRHIKLFLRQPTRSMRLGFAMYIEQMIGDVETAAQIRERLMSDWTRSLIREFAMETWRQQGFQVEYEYIIDTELDDGEAETEIEYMSEDDDDDDVEDEDDIGDMDTDECEAEDHAGTEFGLVKKA